MATWLYQMSQTLWDPQRYRADIWERERWTWPVGQKVGGTPQTGDTVVFFFAPTGGPDPGFYGWAVVLEWQERSETQLRFRAVAPSDHLKMHPWWDETAQVLVDRIRGKVKQGTLWLVNDADAKEVRRGITDWLGARGVPAVTAASPIVKKGHSNASRK